MAKSSGGGGRRLSTKDFRSGRSFLVPQDGSSEMVQFRFNKAANRYEYYKEYKNSNWSRYIPLSDFSRAFGANDYVEALLRKAGKQIRFVD